MLCDEAAEIADDLVGLILILVIEVDEGEAVLQFPGKAAIGELLEMLGGGGEGFLIVVAQEMRQRHVVSGVFHQRAVRKILDHALEQRSRFGEIGVLEKGETLEEHEAIQAFGLRHRFLKFAVTHPDFLPVAASHEVLDGNGGDSLGILRMRILADKRLASVLDLVEVLPLVQDHDLGIGGFFRILGLWIFRADGSKADECFLEAVQIEQAAAAAHQERGVEIGSVLDGFQALFRQLDRRFETGEELGCVGTPVRRLCFLRPDLRFKAFQILAHSFECDDLCFQNLIPRRNGTIDGQRGFVGLASDQLVTADDRLIGKPGDRVAHAALVSHAAKKGRQVLWFSQLREQADYFDGGGGLSGRAHLTAHELAIHCQSLIRFPEIGINLAKP